MNESHNAVNGEQLIADFEVVVADTEALLKATANQGGDKVAVLRARAEESIKLAKTRMAEAPTVLLEKTRVAAKATNVYVHDNPWQAIGAAAAVGLAFGVLIGRC